MNNIWWQTEGEGNCHLVLLHGWGLNSEVWRAVSAELSAHFTVHLVDLPGYGRSHACGALSLPQMAQLLVERAPASAIWLGWSLGGLVASEVALSWPGRVQALVTVASSPCFGERNGWPGIKPTILDGFQQQLSEDFQRTVERFLALQTLGTQSARQDAKRLKSIVLEQTMPTVAVLNTGLEILKQTDQRAALATLTIPFLRLYGYLDGLVPRKIAPILDEQLPGSHSWVFPKAAHAPFISHPDAFCAQVLAFCAGMAQVN